MFLYKRCEQPPVLQLYSGFKILASGTINIKISMLTNICIWKWQ